MARHEVTSEIFVENSNSPTNLNEGSTVSTFSFKYPYHMKNSSSTNKTEPEYDEDGDLILERPEEGKLLIEHKTSTELKLVGLQVWRGAFLLADYILFNPELFRQKTILELGSGVGLASIIASTLVEEVICTDVNLGGILKLIETNFRKNKAIVKSKVCVTELDFLNLDWSKMILDKLDKVSIIIAADVIYDDKITEGFVKTLGKLLNSEVQRVAYVALEKRYVFTIADLDSVAPMYEEFLRCIRRQNHDWIIEEIKLDFPCFFKYNRLEQMVLMKIHRNR